MRAHVATTVLCPQPVDEVDPNPFAFEFRYRNKTKEVGTGIGHHKMSANRYETEAERIAKAVEAAKMATRGDWQEQRFGESPFRKRVQSEEIHPPIRFKSVTEAERINDATNSITTGTGPGADPLTEPQMGFNDIPIGMTPNTVVVRAKAKAPGPLQFKRFHGSGRLLNPPDKYEAGMDLYTPMAEVTGYGFTKTNNFRPRRREREIDQKREFLPGVRGGLTLGTTTSKRADRVDKPVIEHGERKFYCAARTMVVMRPEGEDDAEVMQSTNDGEPETRVELARRMLKQQGVNKTKVFERVDGNNCSNGPNIYAWNELFKFKDHKA